MVSIDKVTALAAELEVTPSTIIHWLHGTTKPHPSIGANFQIRAVEVGLLVPSAHTAAQALSADERAGIERCLRWLKEHTRNIEAQIDDDCDGCDADAFCAEAATIREAAREMAKALGVDGSGT